MSARERILTRIKDALEDRPRVPHPGPFRGERPVPPSTDAVEGFAALFTRAGGEVVRVHDSAQAAAWLASFAGGFEGVAVGATLPPPLAMAALPAGPGLPPDEAALGVSMAVGAVAETGSLLLDARDGRRVQILPPTHVVVVHAHNVHATLSEALKALRPRLSSTLALHSGPSKSADIGQILVKGVHGPGRVVALVVERPDPHAESPTGERRPPS